MAFSSVSLSRWRGRQLVIEGEEKIVKKYTIIGNVISLGQAVGGLTCLSEFRGTAGGEF